MPAFLIVSGNRAPHLAGPQHDVDPTVMHALSYADFWPAFERRYGSNPDLVPARSSVVTIRILNLALVSSLIELKRFLQLLGIKADASLPVGTASEARSD